MNTTRILLFATFSACLILVASAAWAEKESVATLIDGLKSADEPARVQAIDELGARRAAAAEAVQPLSEMLNDGSAKVRAHAASALGQIGAAAKPAVPALVELLKDPDATVRRQAVKAVMSIRPGPQVMVPLCIKLMEDSDPGVRMRILNAISDAGPQAVPGLIAALDNERAAYWACLVLRDMGPAAKDAVPALAAKLEDRQPDVRREAILALAAMEGAAAGAVEPIAAALGNEHTATAATYALGRIGQIPKAAEAVILANVKSGDKVLSVTSLWALARARPEDKDLRRTVTERLIEQLKNENAMVRMAAAHALAGLPPAPEITVPIWEKALENADERTTHLALDAVASLGAPAVPRLVDALKHEKLRGHVIQVLGKIGPAAAPATPALTGLIADKDDDVAYEALMALAKIGPGAKAAVPEVMKVLAGGDKSNVPTAAYVLGKIGPDAAAALPALRGLLAGDDALAAEVSAWALTQIRPGSPEIAAEAVPVLIKALSSPLPEVRQGAVKALGELGPLARSAQDAVEKAAAGDEDEAVKAEAAKALPRIRS
jgi:HEAT repeat protein